MHGHKEGQGQQAEGDAGLEQGHRPDLFLARLAEHVRVDKDKREGRADQQPPAHDLAHPALGSQPVGDQKEGDDGRQGRQHVPVAYQDGALHFQVGLGAVGVQVKGHVHAGHGDHHVDKDQLEKDAKADRVAQEGAQLLARTGRAIPHPLAHQPGKAPDGDQDGAGQEEGGADIDHLVGPLPADHRPGGNRDDGCAHDGGRYRDLVRPPFNAVGADHDQQDHDVDQGEHDVQVGDDHQLVDGVGIDPHDILGEKGLHAVAEKGARRGADGCRDQGKEGHHEEGHALQRDARQVGKAGRVLCPAARGPEGQCQQHPGVEHQGEAHQVDAVKDPVSAGVGKGHAADAGEHIAHGDRRDDGAHGLW